MNWPKYESALVLRGALLWHLFDNIENWYAEQSIRVGRPRDYSDKTILFVLIAAVVMNYELRRAVGAVRHMVKDRNLDLKIPHHSTVSRRMSGLTVRIIPEGEIDRDFFAAPDGTGENPPGPGQWREDKHAAENAQRNMSSRTCRAT